MEIEEGEIVGIIGRNGAGKSTLLKILNMPWNYFEIQLGDGFFIVADFTRVDGIVVSFVVRLMYINEDLELLDIARYDGAHGVPHLDQVDHTGRLIQKLWLPRLDFDLAVEYALEDFKKNYEHYYRTWCKS